MGEPLVRPFVREQKFGPLESKLWMFQKSWVNGPCGCPKAQGAVNCNRGRHQTGPCASPSRISWTWWEPSAFFFFLCSIMCLNQTERVYFFASSSHLYYWNCIHLADNQRNVYIPTEETRRNLNYAAPVISLWRNCSIMHKVRAWSVTEVT